MFEEKQISEGLVTKLWDISKSMFISKFPGIPTKSFPEEEVLGVPQRSYGYLTSEMKEKYRIDKLQTGNIKYCVCIAGYNENGSFLAHIDESTANETSDMMKRLAKKIGNNFHIFVFYNHGFDDKEGYVDDLKNVLKKYSVKIKDCRKRPNALLQIGITLNGELFHPEGNVKNDTVYREEEKLFMGALPEQIDDRTSLGCINEMEGITLT